MPGVMRALLPELSQPNVVALPDWDAAQNQRYSFLLYCDACQDSFGAVIEQQKQGGPYDRSRPSVALPWLMSETD